MNIQNTQCIPYSELIFVLLPRSQAIKSIISTPTLDTSLIVLRPQCCAIPQTIAMQVGTLIGEKYFACPL